MSVSSTTSLVVNTQPTSPTTSTTVNSLLSPNLVKSPSPNNTIRASKSTDNAQTSTLRSSGNLSKSISGSASSPKELIDNLTPTEIKGKIQFNFK